MNDLTTDEAEDVWRRGAEAMREACAASIMCGCDTAEQRAAILAPPNSAARWRACHRTDCLAIMAAEMIELPTPPPPPDLAADGLSYRGG